MAKKKVLKDLTEEELQTQTQKFTGETEDLVFIDRELEWKAEVHPDQEEFQSDN